MTSSYVDLKWKEGMHFEGDIEGYTIALDAGADAGGQGKGTSPKKLLLLGLAGCTSMDVVSILAKMRVPYTTFDTRVEAEQTEEHPKVYATLTILYKFTGAQPEDKDKIEKAISLSLERYCGVAAMLGKTAAITHRLEME